MMKLTGVRVLAVVARQSLLGTYLISILLAGLTLLGLVYVILIKWKMRNLRKRGLRMTSGRNVKNPELCDSVLPFFIKLVTVYLLSSLSVFFLDGIFTVILIERQPNSPIELAAYIALSTFLRAILADWLTVKIPGIWGSDRSKFSFWGLTLAALIYGVPILIISEHVFKSIHAVLFAFSMWLDKVLPITYVNTLVGILMYILIFDFSRLILFLVIKRLVWYKIKRRC